MIFAIAQIASTAIVEADPCQGMDHAPIVEPPAPQTRESIPLGRGKKKASDDTLKSVYAETGSVWKTAARVGMCGQSVYERLVKMGIVKKLNVFTEDEKAFIAENYNEAADTGNLAELAAIMGRTKESICRMAGIMGLTDRRRKKPYLNGAALDAWRAVNKHPRGFLGGKHTETAREVMSKVSTDRWKSMTDEERDNLIIKRVKARAANNSVPQCETSRSWKSEWREVGGRRIFFRSAWEANYARYLEMLKAEGQIQSWEHESKTFWFEGLKRGAVSYLPDFEVTALDGTVTFHEIKGWMDDRSKTKIGRMARYHPEVALVVVDAKAYRELSKKWRWIIDGWEFEKHITRSKKR